MSNKLGKQLKQGRLLCNKSVKDVSDYMTAIGYKATPNTIYSWENNNSQPTPDALLDLCRFYGINDVLGYFGYESAHVDLNTTDSRLVKLNDIFHQLNERGKQYLYDTAVMCAGNPQYQPTSSTEALHIDTHNNKKARPLKEQAGDEIIEIPVAARSGEQASIVTTKEKLDRALSSLVPNNDLDL